MMIYTILNGILVYIFKRIQSMEMIDVRFPAIFSACQKNQCSFDDVGVVFSGSDVEETNYRIEFIGPFIFILRPDDEVPRLLIFTPNFLPQLEDNKIVLQAIAYSEYSDVNQTFVFDSKETQLSFQKAFFKSISDLHDRITEISNKKMRGKYGEVKCIFIEKRTMKSCNLVLNHTVTSYSIQAHAENADGDFLCFLDMDLDSSSTVSTLLKTPPAFKTNHLCLYFSIIDGNTCKETIFKGRNLNDTLNWILAVHTSIFLASAKKYISATNTPKVTKSGNPNSTPQRDPKMNGNCCSTSDSFEDEKDGQIEMKVEDIIESRSIPTIPKNCHQKSNGNFHLNTISENEENKQSNSESDDRTDSDYKESDEKLSDSDITSTSESLEDRKSEEEERKENERNEKFEQLRLSLENTRKISNGHIPEVYVPPENKIEVILPSFIDKSQVNNQIQSVLNSIGNFGINANFDNFANCDQRPLEQIIEDACSTGHDSLNISDYVRIRDYPLFDFNQLYKASEPKRPFIEQFLNSLTSLKITEEHKVVESHKLCFVLCALFLNGLKGFKSFGLEHEFLDAIYALSPFVDGLDKIYTKISQEPTILTQISQFVISILNSQILIPIIEAIVREEDWQAEFYSISSHMRDYETLKQILSLSDFIFAIEFDIDETTPIIANTSHEEKVQYIFKPAYSYLGLNEIDKSQDNEKIQKEIADFFVSELNNGTNHKGWQFLNSVINSEHVNINCEFRLLRKSVRNAKKLPSDERIKAIFEEGAKFGLLHIWFIMMITFPETNLYFERDSTFTDMFRAKYVISELAELMKKFDP
ncbi:hypothetical protein TRFO_23128 [Tritrichomonas foetus]|uniref:RUN domain-containing protein n=1 Tax=Tritrichomonas foetus TaxID=1144522 RepID=A0A1J4KBX5_9EUKA|nr:hypothetical protein TRFO_23128 [Tritrichomonas foetus]|eukprot:OHT08432.1 hypothetical protein TRFO_23128 [Tritrichomonas foetus]